MAKSNVAPVNITILGKEFQVASPEDEHQTLLQAASFLDERMREIRSSGKVLGLERIAVMAALNLSYELLNTPKFDSADASEIKQRIELIETKIDDALQQSEQIGLTDNP
ncbi:cell division protein ZapA [Kangiella sediminilitoris]|uniref:Cell division protein ZapA n=1 Tax=Kangiella sediminilitoris TaxID=1144748 RepID=A0A1B3B7W0_9GAMM|nr:cell division protein ZapA [Kangiella sediminilitoris]AOE48879.1 cell division protein ZapA [Kangiella sediminilitoris]